MSASRRERVVPIAVPVTDLPIFAVDDDFAPLVLGDFAGTLTSTVEISRWILSWGAHAKAVAPIELVKTITQTLQETMGRYSIP